MMSRETQKMLILRVNVMHEYTYTLLKRLKEHIIRMAHLVYCQSFICVIGE